MTALDTLRAATTARCQAERERMAAARLECADSGHRLPVLLPLRWQRWDVSCTRCGERVPEVVR